MKRRSDTSFILFDVLYDDGSRSSRRKVPRGLAEGLNGNAEAKAAIEVMTTAIAVLEPAMTTPLMQFRHSPPLLENTAT